MARKLLAALLLATTMSLSAVETVSVEKVSLERPQKVRAKNLKPGDLVPDISLTTVDGKKVKLSDYAGKPVLIDFWSTTCGPCIAEAPNVLKQYKKYKEQGLQVLYVSLDYDAKKLQKYLAKKQLPFTHFRESRGFRGEAVRAFGFSGIPQIILLDAEQKVVGANLRGTDIPDAIATSFATKEQKKKFSVAYSQLSKAFADTDSKAAAASLNNLQQLAYADRGLMMKGLKALAELKEAPAIERLAYVKWLMTMPMDWHEGDAPKFLMARDHYRLGQFSQALKLSEKARGWVFPNKLNSQEIFDCALKVSDGEMAWAILRDNYEYRSYALAKSAVESLMVAKLEGTAKAEVVRCLQVCENSATDRVQLKNLGEKDGQNIYSIIYDATRGPLTKQGLFAKESAKSQARVFNANGSLKGCGLRLQVEGEDKLRYSKMKYVDGKWHAELSLPLAKKAVFYFNNWRQDDNCGKKWSLPIK